MPMLFFARRIAIVAVALAALHPLAAAEPVFEEGDTVAIVGGADAAASDDDGFVEALLTSARPDLRLRFRNFAREGDTVFQRPRDHAFPTVPDQLQAAGADVAIVWFGRAEALDRAADPGAFADAYHALLGEISAVVPRLVLVTPPPFESPASPLVPDLGQRNGILSAFAGSIREMGEARGSRVVDLFSALRDRPAPRLTDGGLPLNAAGHRTVAETMADSLFGRHDRPDLEALRQAVLEKNRLWFQYARPQNWAFLGGDRSDQPSSRDHLNPSVRWFPAEMEQYLPLIEAADAKIHQLSDLTPPKP